MNESSHAAKLERHRASLYRVEPNGGVVHAGFRSGRAGADTATDTVSDAVGNSSSNTARNTLRDALCDAAGNTSGYTANYAAGYALRFERESPRSESDDEGETGRDDGQCGNQSSLRHANLLEHKRDSLDELPFSEKRRRGNGREGRAGMRELEQGCEGGLSRGAAQDNF